MNRKFIWLLFMFVKRSMACVEWKLIDKPVIFGKTAKLSCLLENDLGNFSTRTWTGGKHFSALSYQGVSTNPEKYSELVKVNGNKNKIESILHIFRFDENDVNCYYSCTIGLHENKKKLELTKEDFEMHPTSDSALVLAILDGGYLEVLIRLTKVFPAPTCYVMFNEITITERIISHIGMNGIFFNLTERFYHTFESDVCSGKLAVLCRTGSTQRTIYKETFRTCKKRKESNADKSDKVIDQTSYCIASFLVCFVILLIIVARLIYIGKYNLRKLMCSVSICCVLISRERRQDAFRSIYDVLESLSNDAQTNSMKQYETEA